MGEPRAARDGQGAGPLAPGRRGEEGRGLRELLESESWSGATAGVTGEQCAGAATRARAMQRTVVVVLREALLVAAAYLLYQRTSDAAPRRKEPAVDHLRVLMHAEHAAHLDVEAGFNGWWVQQHGLLVVGNWYYAVLHFLVPSLALLVVFLRRPEIYRGLRSALLVATLIGLAVFWLWPVAPPRLLPHGGFVDAVALMPTLGGGPYNGPYGTAGENPYAAMPSLHVAWAAWAALAIWMLTRRTLLRLLGCLHVLVTVVIIVGTANHLFLDAVAGVAATTVGFLVVVVVGYGWDRLAPSLVSRSS